jgi:hypothetical protein
MTHASPYDRESHEDGLLAERSIAEIRVIYKFHILTMPDTHSGAFIDWKDTRDRLMRWMLVKSERTQERETGTLE